MSRRPNVVQAGGGNGMDVLGSIIGGWQRKKELDFRYSRENDLMTRQHELNMERDTHRAKQQAIAQGTGAAIQTHFDTMLEGTKSAHKLEQIDASGNQERLTVKESGKQDRRTFTHRGKQDRLTMADKDTYETGQKTLDSDNKIKQTRESGSQERRTITHTGKRNITDMRTLSKDLDANAKDTSTGISPLVAGPGSLQNIGPLLRDHPLLNGKSSSTPAAPAVGNPSGPDSSGEATVTAPKVKKPRAPRAKKTGTYDDSYGGA
jgi:hypothetical protein